MCPINRESLYALHSVNKYYDLRLKSRYNIDIDILSDIDKPYKCYMSTDRINFILYQIIYNKDINLIMRIYEVIRPNLKKHKYNIYLICICMSILQCLTDNQYYGLGLKIYRDIDRNNININVIINPYPLLRYSNIDRFIHILNHIGYKNTYKCVPYLNTEQIEFIYSDKIYSIDKIVNLPTVEILNISNMILYLRKPTYTSIYSAIKHNEDPYIRIYELYDSNIGSIGSLLDTSLSVNMYNYISVQFDWNSLYTKNMIDKLHNLYHLFHLISKGLLTITINNDTIELRYKNDTNMYVYKINPYILELLNDIKLKST